LERAEIKIVLPTALPFGRAFLLPATLIFVKTVDKLKIRANIMTK
jgi:hypothetical protein